VAVGSAAGGAGAGVLLHPPRSSNPVNPIDSMPPRECAICLFLRPLVECSGLKNACFFMILSLDKNFLFCIAVATCGFSLRKAAADWMTLQARSKHAFARAVSAFSAQTQKPKFTADVIL
jgi:hypothetical protein